jgi:large subunit ribosomal protein L23
MKNQNNLYDLLIKPVMTEKSNDLSSRNKYTFFVDRKSNKSLISRSVEFVFNVKVSDVNVLNSKAKNVRFKGVNGKQSSKKKAIVTLVDGYKIDLSRGE